MPASVRGAAALKQRSAGGDLLDANESNWALVMIGTVDCAAKDQVTALAWLAVGEGNWSYCGRTADARNGADRVHADGSSYGDPEPGTSTRACIIHPVDLPAASPSWVVSLTTM